MFKQATSRNRALTLVVVGAACSCAPARRPVSHIGTYTTSHSLSLKHVATLGSPIQASGAQGLGVMTQRALLTSSS